MPWEAACLHLVDVCCLDQGAALTRSGGFMLPEHPRVPSDADEVSFWHLDVVHLLQQLPEVTLRLVEKWRSCQPHWAACAQDAACDSGHVL